MQTPAPGPPSEPPPLQTLKRARVDQQAALASTIQRAVADGIQASVPLTPGSELFRGKRVHRSFSTDTVSYCLGRRVDIVSTAGPSNPKAKQKVLDDTMSFQQLRA